SATNGVKVTSAIAGSSPPSPEGCGTVAGGNAPGTTPPQRMHPGAGAGPAIDGVCGQELLGPDFAPSAPDRSQFSCLYEEAEFFDRFSSEARFVSHLSTCNCSVRKSSFDKVGGFDEIFTGNSYGDDTDLAMRLAQAGCRIYFDPQASVRHLKWR